MPHRLRWGILVSGTGMHFLALTLLLLLSTASIAAQPDFGQLAETPRWQALMHVNQGATLRNRGRSYVPDERFFLARDGGSDLSLELEASWHLLRDEGSEWRCRFPARYRFLAESLGWDEADPLGHCEEYLAWRQQVPAHSVDLVFPASYLNSPSSMFGHTLLRLNSDREDDSDWLQHAVNFGADVGDMDNSMLYVYRGLAGGYPGRFTIVPYMVKIQEYAHLENRDMWEYRLSLTPDEVDWMVSHLWELRDIDFDYYFLDENCSFRLLELVEVARPDTGIMRGFRMTEVPVDTVRALEQAGLIESLRYRPSKEVELNHRISQLTPAQRRLARALARDASVAETEAFLAEPEAARHQMARTAYEYLRFRHRRGERDQEVARRSLAILRVVNANRGGEQLPIPQPVPPEVGHDTRMLSVSGGEFADYAFGELQFRMTYHDLYDNSTGFLRGAQIEGINIRVRKFEDEEAKLQRLDVVNIRSLAPRNRFVRPISWFVQGGAERVPAGDRFRLVRYVQGGPGMSWRLGPVIPYTLLLARAENSSAWEQTVETAFGASAGAIWYAGPMQIGVGSEGYRLLNDAFRHDTTLTMHVALARNHGLRGEVERQRWRDNQETEWRLGWRYYF